MSTTFTDCSVDISYSVNYVTPACWLLRLRGWPLYITGLTSDRTRSDGQQEHLHALHLLVHQFGALYNYSTRTEGQSADWAGMVTKYNFTLSDTITRDPRWLVITPCIQGPCCLITYLHFYFLHAKICQCKYNLHGYVNVVAAGGEKCLVKGWTDRAWKLEFLRTVLVTPLKFYVTFLMRRNW